MEDKRLVVSEEMHKRLKMKATENSRSIKNELDLILKKELGIGDDMNGRGDI